MGSRDDFDALVPSLGAAGVASATGKVPLTFDDSSTTSSGDNDEEESPVAGTKVVVLDDDGSSSSPGDNRSPATNKRSKSSAGIGCRECYLEHFNKKNVLLAMCLGAEEGNPSFGDVERDDCYMNARNKRSFQPTRVDLLAEVSRRFAKENGGKQRKCSSWSKQKARDWLLVHPITDEADLDFLKAEEKMLRDTLLASAAERATQLELHDSNTADAWVGKEPWLRMYHAILEDEVLTSYKRVHEWADRESTDARNSFHRPKTFEELCANKYNDPSFEPVSNVYLDLHDDFMSPIVLRQEDAPFVSPDKIKDKLSSARCKALRVISDWEKSGNGSGQRAEDNNEFGHIADDQQWLGMSEGFMFSP